MQATPPTANRLLIWGLLRPRLSSAWRETKAPHSVQLWMQTRRMAASRNQRGLGRRNRFRLASSMGEWWWRLSRASLPSAGRRKGGLPQQCRR